MGHFSMQRLVPVVFATLTLASPSAFASFEFGPIMVTLTPTGSGATASYQAVNSTKGKVAIQISVVSREPNQLGEEVYKESDEVDDQFKVFPAQLVLAPGETRTVRITYVGTPKLKSEVAYRVLAEELPVDLEDPNKKINKAVARLNISTKYVGSLYVAPAGVAPKLEADAVPVESGKDRTLQLTVKNSGTAHAMLKKPTLKLHPLAGGADVELSGNEVKEFAEQNVLAGKSRLFHLPWPKTLPVGAVKVSLDLAKD